MKKKIVKCVLETQYIHYGIEKLRAEKNASQQEVLQCAAQRRAVATVYSILFSAGIEEAL